MDLYEKLESMKSNIRSLESVAVAFSGGVDSTFLLKVAYEVLDEKVLAVTARSSTYPEREYNEAVEFTEQYGIRHQIIVSEELDVEGFSDNPINRCYLCKSELFTKIKEVAVKENIKNIIEGSNFDDMTDFRPGLKAIKELGIVSPLREALLTKDEIRLLSKEMGLKTWDKPSFACLSSRFPYGEKITIERLSMIDKAEQFLLDLGFKQVRVRFHGDIARIEIQQKEFVKLLDPDLTQRIYQQFNQIGFLYTTLDIKGYRTGSMNEGLKNNPASK